MAQPKPHRTPRIADGFALHAVLESAKQAAFLDLHGQELLDGLTRTQSVFTRDDMINAISSGPYPGMDIAQAAKLTDRLLADQDRVLASAPGPDNSVVYTTPEMLKVEQDMVALARKMAGDGKPMIDESQKASEVTRFLDGTKGFFLGVRPDKFENPDMERALGEEIVERQEQVMNQLLDEGSFKLLVGAPGSGKTFFMKQFADIAAKGEIGMTEDGKPNVIAVAISDKIKTDLANDLGAPGFTLGELKAHAPAQPGGMMVVDEIGLLSTRQLHDLLQYADENQMTVVGLGDPEQITPEGAGNPLPQLMQEIGAAQLTHILRQKSWGDRQAGTAIREKNSEAGLTHYENQGAFNYGQNAGEVIDWGARQAAEAILNGEDRPIVLTPDRDEADAVNARVREVLKENGQLPDGQAIETADGQTREFATGEPVILNETIKHRGLSVPKGSTATVSGVDENGIKLKIDGMTVKVDGKKEPVEITIPADDMPDLEHAYALDLRRAQGVSNDNVAFLVTRELDPGEGLVGLTRHKEGLTVGMASDVYPDIQSLANDLDKPNAKPAALDYYWPNAPKATAPAEAAAEAAVVLPSNEATESLAAEDPVRLSVGDMKFVGGAPPGSGKSRLPESKFKV